MSDIDIKFVEETEDDGYWEQVVSKLDEVLERLDTIEEALRNISTPGGNFSIFDTD